jgi:hypothetical protein
MITDEQVESALDYLRDSAKPAAVARAQAKTLEKYLGVVEAQQKSMARGLSNAAAQDQARSSPEYKQAWLGRPPCEGSRRKLGNCFRNTSGERTQMKAGPSIVIHAERRFTGRKLTPATSYPAERMLSSSTRMWLDLSAFAAIFFLAGLITLTHYGWSMKSGESE